MIPVVVAIVRRSDGRILVGQRRADKPYPLQWEFPGGKVEEGELPTSALMRELSEELGINVEVGRLLHQQIASYSDERTFLIAYYLVEAWQGVIVNNDFEQVRWIDVQNLHRFHVLEGNRSICRLLLDHGIEGLPYSPPR